MTRDQHLIVALSKSVFRVAYIAGVPDSYWETDESIRLASVALGTVVGYQTAERARSDYMRDGFTEELVQFPEAKLLCDEA